MNSMFGTCHGNRWCWSQHVSSCRWLCTHVRDKHYVHYLGNVQCCPLKPIHCDCIQCGCVHVYITSCHVVWWSTLHLIMNMSWVDHHDVIIMSGVAHVNTSRWVCVYNHSHVIQLSVMYWGLPFCEGAFPVHTTHVISLCHAIVCSDV